MDPRSRTNDNGGDGRRGDPEAGAIGLPQVADDLRRRASQIRRGRPSPDMDTAEQIEAAIVTRLTAEAFDVLSKGLAPNRFDHYMKGLRSKVYRDGKTPNEHLTEIFGKVLSRDRSDLTGQLLKELGEAWGDPENDREDLLRQLGTAYYLSARDDPALPLETAAWLAALQRGDIRDDYVAFHRSLDAQVADGFEALFSLWGRRIAHGFTWRQFALAMSCVLEGMVRRARLEPDAVMDDLVARVCITLAGAMTEQIAS